MGFAKNGMPVVLVRARLWNPHKYSIDEYVKYVPAPLHHHNGNCTGIRYVAYFMEQNIKRAEAGSPAKPVQNYVRVIFVAANTYCTAVYRVPTSI